MCRMDRGVDMGVVETANPLPEDVGRVEIAEEPGDWEACSNGCWTFFLADDPLFAIV